MLITAAKAPEPVSEGMVAILEPFTDTTLIWSLSYITIAFMTVPNLIGLWILRKEIKSTIAQYWVDFSAKYPNDRMSKRFLKNGRL